MREPPHRLAEALKPRVTQEQKPVARMGWMALVAAMVACGDGTGPPPPLSWSPVASGTTRNLWDVWGFSARDVWAVGDFGTILHYQGTRWAPALDSTSHFFRGVWGSGPKDVWAVGYRGLLSPTPVIFHYDGEAWTRDATLTDTLSWPPLTDVWGTSASNVWAVGYGGLVLHFDGLTWTKASVDPAAYADRIWGTSAMDAWIVGPWTALRWDGKSWSPSSDSVLTAKQLFSGWGARRDDQWAAGAPVNGFLHFDGRQWTRVSPADTASGFIAGMWGLAPSRIWAVARTGSSGPGDGTIWQYDGSRWLVVAREPVNLTGVWASSESNVWVAGDGGTILHGTSAR